MSDFNCDNIKYPALYVASDEKAVRAQKIYVCGVALLLILVILTSLSTLFVNYHKIIAILSLVFISFTPIVSLILGFKRYDRIWYTGRSLAESIKTMSWRYMMRSQPYEYDDKNDLVVKTEFINGLRRIFQNNADFCKELFDTTFSPEELSQSLGEIRERGLAERKQIYLECRIDDQQSWYWKKGLYNNKMANRWFWSMIFIQILAIISASLKIAYFNWSYLPTDIFMAGVGSIVGWIQVKRFQELGSSYPLAAREIGMAKALFSDIANEQQFSDFVKDTENAFSREHTQWFARRDS